MKKNQIIFGMLLLISLASSAQVSVNVNLGTPPVWAPAERVETQYYYLPDVDAYYDVPSAKFIYIKNGTWFRSAALPYRYRNYNLRDGNVVYLTDYRGNSPYSYHKNHVMKYSKKIKYKEFKENNDDFRHDNGKGHGKGNKH